MPIFVFAIAGTFYLVKKNIMVSQNKRLFVYYVTRGVGGAGGGSFRGRVKIGNDRVLGGGG